MINKTKLALIAAVAALGIAMPAAAMARSSHGADLYDYAPGYDYNHAQVPQWWDRSDDYYRNGEF